MSSAVGALLIYGVLLMEYTVEKVPNEVLRDIRKHVKQSMDKACCAWCGKTGKHGCLEFRDELSRKEYSISGFCQSCQDKTFGGSQ